MEKESKPQEEIDIINFYNSSENIEKTMEKFKRGYYFIKNILNKNGLKKGSKRRYSLELKYFEKIDSPEKAYWLGFIAADGHITKTRYRMSLVSKDKCVLEGFKKCIGFDGPIKDRAYLDKRTGKEYYAHYIEINSKEFCQYLAIHGVNENKSKHFKFPKIKKKFYSHFVRGLFDGDGSVSIGRSKVKNNIRIHVNLISSFDCNIFIQNFLTKDFDISSHRVKNKLDWGISYLIVEKDSIKFLEWLYRESLENMRLDRKYQIYMQNKDELTLRGKQYTVQNILTGEEFITNNMSLFCKENNISQTNLLTSYRKNIQPKRGKNSFWKIKLITENQRVKLKNI